MFFKCFEKNGKICIEKIRQKNVLKKMVKKSICVFVHALMNNYLIRALIKAWLGPSTVICNDTIWISWDIKCTPIFQLFFN